MIRFHWPESSWLTCILIKLAMKTCELGDTYDHLEQAYLLEDRWKKHK